MATRDLASLHDKLAAAHRSVNAWEEAITSASEDAWGRLHNAHVDLDGVHQNLSILLSNTIRYLPTTPADAGRDG